MWGSKLLCIALFLVQVLVFHSHRERVDLETDRSRQRLAKILELASYDFREPAVHDAVQPLLQRLHEVVGVLGRPLTGAFVEPREMTYLYADGSSFIFMDKTSYEQLTLDADFLEGQSGYLLPNTDIQVNFHNERPIGVQLPGSVVLTVVETEPTLKGATATGSFKPAKTETGMNVMVPQFISEGEKIKVNTDTGEYMERA